MHSKEVESSPQTQIFYTYIFATQSDKTLVFQTLNSGAYEEKGDWVNVSPPPTGAPQGGGGENVGISYEMILYE